eukprot:g16526.t1
MHALVLSREPLFSGKAKLFPGVCFVVGHDTAIRLIMPKYYDNSFDKMLATFGEMRGKGVHFLVAGRLASPPASSSLTPTTQPSLAFLTLADVHIPYQLKDLFSALPFRADVSSTELRAKMAAQREKQDRTRNQSEQDN